MFQSMFRFVINVTANIDITKPEYSFFLALGPCLPHLGVNTQFFIKVCNGKADLALHVLPEEIAKNKRKQNDFIEQDRSIKKNRVIDAGELQTGESTPTTKMMDKAEQVPDLNAEQVPDLNHLTVKEETTPNVKEETTPTKCIVALMKQSPLSQIKVVHEVNVRMAQRERIDLLRSLYLDNGNRFIFDSRHFYQVEKYGISVYIDVFSNKNWDDEHPYFLGNSERYIVDGQVDDWFKHDNFSEILKHGEVSQVYQTTKNIFDFKNQYFGTLFNINRTFESTTMEQYFINHWSMPKRNTAFSQDNWMKDENDAPNFQ
jgi:hypothetical protein